MKYVVFCIVAVTAGAGCHSDFDTPASDPLVKVSPRAVSNDAAWALFDRSISSSFTPDTTLISIAFESNVSLAGIKVYGSSPYELEVRGKDSTSLGFETVDLSSMSPGWHSVRALSVTSTATVELTFHSKGGTGGVPELEFWSASSQLPAPHGAVDLTADQLPAGYAVAPGIAPSGTIEHGRCISFDVELQRPASLFRTSYVTYSAVGLFRSFELERRINGVDEQGGSWLAGGSGEQTFVERSVLRAIVVTA